MNMVALCMQNYPMLYRHINILLACCRATTLFQMNLSYLQGLQVYLLHRFSFCFFSLPGGGCCQVYGSAVWAAAPASDHGCSCRLQGGSLVENLVEGKWARVCSISAFKEVMVLPPIMHSKP